MLMTTILILSGSSFRILKQFLWKWKYWTSSCDVHTDWFGSGRYAAWNYDRSNIELVWLGAFPIGASNPPDYTSGAILGTCYVILSGADPASAVLLAVPIATLVARLADLMMMFIVPMCGHKADRYAEAGDCDGVDRMHYLAILVQVIPQALLVGMAYYFGSSVIETVLDAIPSWLTSGMSYATGIIPAIGFATDCENDSE